MSNEKIVKELKDLSQKVRDFQAKLRKQKNPRKKKQVVDSLGLADYYIVKAWKDFEEGKN